MTTLDDMTNDSFDETRSKTRSGRIYGQLSHHEPSFDLANTLSVSVPNTDIDASNTTANETAENVTSSPSQDPTPKPFISQITSPRFDHLFTNYDGPYNRAHLTQSTINQLRFKALWISEEYSHELQNYTGAKKMYEGHLARLGGIKDAVFQREWRVLNVRMIGEAKERMENAQEACRKWMKIMGLIDEMEGIREKEQWC